MSTYKDKLNKMTLTEQYKNRKLEFGKEYYVRFEDGEISTARWCYYTNQNRYGFDVDEVKEVLAPVPSYEEYSRLEWYAGYGPDRIVELNKENKKLKELLKESLSYINNFFYV